MPTNTSRLALVMEASTDNESGFPAREATTYGILDNAIVRSSGTLAARPAANTVEVDHVYKATDVNGGTWYIGDGTNWNALMIAGAWTNLTLGTNIGAFSGATPQYRTVGDKVEFSGIMVNNTGGNLTVNYVLASNVPAPSATRGMAAGSSASSSAVSIYIQADTNLKFLNGTVGNGFNIYLDGLSYRVL